jgi:molybdopterin/thiamine biosynthesis adenylyltransferase
LGGIGAPAAALLARAGVGRLTLVDPDTVELSNLPRQPLYGTADLGEPKVEAAVRRLRAHHPAIALTPHAERLDAASARRVLSDCDVILDGTDNLASKVLLNQAALDLGVPLVHAGAIGLEGQLVTILPHRTACLRCLFVELPDEDDLPSCQQAGILGPVVGAIGLAAAREALAVLEGRDPPLADRLAVLDAARLRWRVVELRPNPRCPACHAARQPAEAER